VKILEVTQGGNDVGTTTGLDLPVEIKVDLGGVSLEDVSVEVVYGSLDNKGNLETCTAVKASQIDGDTPPGQYRLKAVIPCPQSGRFGFAARLLPRHTDLAHPFLPGLITWEDGESPVKSD